MTFNMPELPPVRTPEENRDVRLAVAENAQATARAYEAEAAHHPEGSPGRKLLIGYSDAYRSTAKALFEAANR